MATAGCRRPLRRGKVLSDIPDFGYIKGQMFTGSFFQFLGEHRVLKLLQPDKHAQSGGVTYPSFVGLGDENRFPQQETSITSENVLIPDSFRFTGLDANRDQLVSNIVDPDTVSCGLDSIIHTVSLSSFE